jgi:dolichyl-phosphate-mannose-protein mannosyltransferase
VSAERSRRVRLFAGSIAATIGAAAAIRYHQIGVTLSHYDARGHLIVARRIFDSITPGWQQIGAVWLPLPHLLNAVPVQIDAFYRSGASAVAMSIASFALAAAAIAWIVLQLTESAPAAIAATAVFVLNPNVVYLQATPMTEPMLLGLMTFGVALLVRSAEASRYEASRATEREGFSRAGTVLALACLTRYEAWPVTYVALAAAVWARWRQGESLRRSIAGVTRIAIYPTAAILAFALFSRVVVGQWFVSSDFFVPENKAQGLPRIAMDEIVWGARELSGRYVIALGVAGCAALLAAGLFIKRRAGALIALSLAATAAVPWAAFVDGHPFRIRYVVPLIAIEAVAVGFLTDFAAVFVERPFQGRGQGRGRGVDDRGPKRAALRTTLATFVVGIALYELHPFDIKAPMVVEAQWDRVNVAPRHEITKCLKSRYHGESIMASMGSLGHYMQEASHDGFNVRDFLHEGNGDIWLAALNTPRIYAGWLLIEEKAEGGDMLYKRARENPEFLRGFSRICEGAGVALYERQNRIANVNK